MNWYSRTERQTAEGNSIRPDNRYQRQPFPGCGSVRLPPDWRSRYYPNRVVEYQSRWRRYLLFVSLCTQHPKITNRSRPRVLWIDTPQNISPNLCKRIEPSIVFEIARTVLVVGCVGLDGNKVINRNVDDWQRQTIIRMAHHVGQDHPLKPSSNFEILYSTCTTLVVSNTISTIVVCFHQVLSVDIDFEMERHYQANVLIGSTPLIASLKQERPPKVPLFQRLFLVVLVAVTRRL